MRKFTCGRTIEEPALLDALARVEALPVVKAPVRCDDSSCTPALIANLWCASTHEKKHKQPSVKLNAKPLMDLTAVPTFVVAAEKLFLKIKAEHAGCHAAAEAAKAKARTVALYDVTGAFRLCSIYVHPDGPCCCPAVCLPSLHAPEFGCSSTTCMPTSPSSSLHACLYPALGCQRAARAGRRRAALAPHQVIASR